MGAGQPDLNVDEWVARQGLPLDEGRERAERLIARAVELSLDGASSAVIAHLDRELEPIARHRFQEAINRGEAPGLGGYRASSGLPIT